MHNSNNDSGTVIAADLSELLEIARESVEPAKWSQAVTFTRNNTFVLEEQNESTFRIKIVEQGKPFGVIVELNAEDGEWSSDCNCHEDPCLHILAGIISAKNRVNLKLAEDSGTSRLVYTLSVVGAELRVKREIETKGERSEFKHRLIDYTGGSLSGRIAGPKLSLIKEDFAVEHLIERDGSFPAQNSEELLSVLQQFPNVEFKGKKAKIQTSASRISLVLYFKSGYYHIYPKEKRSSLQLKNCCIQDDDVITPAIGAELPAAYQAAVSETGLQISESKVLELLTEVLPQIEKYADIDYQVTLPTLYDEEPYCIFQVNKEGENVDITPRLLYGRPPILEITQTGSEQLRSDLVVYRRLDSEKKLIRRLQNELHLQIARTVQKRGAEAVTTLGRLKTWEISGDGIDTFSNEGALKPSVKISEEGITFDFTLPSSVPDPAGFQKSASSIRVFDAWEKGESLVPLLEGGWAEIPKDWFKQHGELIQELLSLERTEKGIVPKFRPLLFQAAEDLEAPLSASLENLRKNLEGVNFETEYQFPRDLTAQLRDYQKTGIQWLSNLRKIGAGAILADDMGLGKTLQVICLFDERSLVVAPTSVLDSWCEQIELFRPQLSVCRYHGSGRSFSSETNVVITSYGILRGEPETFSEFWQLCALDETQHIKNPDSITAKAAFDLQAGFRIALTGTPIENKLVDLWSQFHYCFPELLGTRNAFEKVYVRDIRRGKQEKTNSLRRRIRPFLLRRMKKDVAQELPEKTEIVLRCDLNTQERELYDAYYLSSRKIIKDALQDKSQLFSALQVLLKLRQICAHTSLLKEQEQTLSTKAALLLESLLNSNEAGHRSLVFSQWTSMLNLLEPEIQAAGLSFVRLDGSTRNRKEIIDTFQAEDGPDLILLSLKAGGVGITLTAADHIYLYDSWWNPAVEDQAADRAHRIGQKNPVFVYRLIARNTVEENVLKLQEKKRALAESMLSNEGESSGITIEDLRLLFSNDYSNAGS